MTLFLLTLSEINHQQSGYNDECLIPIHMPQAHIQEVSDNRSMAESPDS